MEIKTPTREERIAFHIRGIKMSIVPSLLGGVAGFLSSPYMLSTAHQPFAFLILAIAIYAQKFIFPPMGIDSKAFGFKDWFFLGFLTFSFWYVTMTVIYNGLPNGIPQFGPFF